LPQRNQLPPPPYRRCSSWFGSLKNMVGGSADKASKVKSLLASYYDTGDDGAEALTLHDTPRLA
jgi:hypothetical protein